MNSNIEIIKFVENNYLILWLMILFLIRIIPPEWAGFWKYNNNKESDGNAPKLTLLHFFLHNAFDSILRAFLIPLLGAFVFKNIVTLVILIVVLFDVFVQHQISAAAVTLVGIGIVSLYLERLIETGKQIKLFGGLLSWEKDNNKSPQSEPPIEQPIPERTS